MTDDDIALLPALDMRYIGQSFELTIPLTDLMSGTKDQGPGIGELGSQIPERFHTAHQRRFSYASEGEPVEIVNLRLKGIGQTAKPEFFHESSGSLDPKAAHVGYKQVLFADPGTPHTARPIPAALYQRERLLPGNIVVGPAVVFQMDTTSIIPPGWAATVDGWRNLIVEAR
jgi:N-methylhydantoinase A